MALVVFHRQYRQKRIVREEVIEGVDVQEKSDIKTESIHHNNIQIKNKNPEARKFSEFSYSLNEKGKSLVLSFEALEGNSRKINGVTLVPVTPWTQYNVFYQPNTRKLEVVDLTSINSVVLGVGNNQDNFIARVLTTDTETLIYLRGRIKNVPGFKNILVIDEENSAQAFAYYSSKAKHFLEDNIRRRNSLGKVDVYKYLCLLETQVDILTKIVLEKDLVQDDNLKSILNEAVGCSACVKSAHKTLKKRLQYKKQVQFCQEYC